MQLRRQLPNQHSELLILESKLILLGVDCLYFGAVTNMVGSDVYSLIRLPVLLIIFTAHCL